MTTTRPTCRVASAAMILASAMFATACGNDATAADEPTEPDTVTVRAVDFTFEDLPEEVSTGTTFELVNAADTELHELVAIRLPDDEDRSVAELVQLPPDELAAFFPEVRTVLLAPPGDAPVIPAVGDGTLTDPGRYAFICAIPTGADPDAYLAAAAESDDGPPDVPGGPPHLAQGMYAEVTVTE